MQSFEDRALKGLIRCGVLESAYSTIIIAVSGGADSIALLTALAKLASGGRLPRSQFDKKITALTIDHGIRPTEESGGDAEFVRDYCARLGVKCVTARFARGEVAKAAGERGMGIEEAARFLRYEAFERALDETPDSILCTAHTQDDNLETILMRFLQGGAPASLAGIPALRGRIARPMLNIQRRDVLSYLDSLGIGYRRDSTNSDTAYLRNNIRLNLIPALNKYFAGWQKAVLAGAEKARDDAEAIRAQADAAAIDTFFAQPMAVRRELVYKAWNALANPSKPRGRLPYEIVSRVCGGNLPARYDGIVFEKTERGIAARWDDEQNESGFFALIEQPGTYAAGGWTFCVGAGNGGARVELPACVRSPLPTDRIVFSRENKSVIKLFSAAKIPACERIRIPVLESRGGIAVVFGSALGRRDWVSARSEQFAENPAAPASVCVKFEGASHG